MNKRYGLTHLSRCPLSSPSYVGGHRPSKIIRFVDKIAKSKYFQKATETEFIKKKMEEVSNTPLLLSVEVQECKGTLAVNIPPPPTDRIWYIPPLFLLVNSDLLTKLQLNFNRFMLQMECLHTIKYSQKMHPLSIH